MPIVAKKDGNIEEYFYPSRNFSIMIDLSRDEYLSQAGVESMRDRYLLKEYNKSTKEWVFLENSPQECFARASCEFGSNQAHAQRLYDYVSNLWAMYATPILCNAGTNKGLPISCFLGQVDDSRAGIVDHIYENAFLSSYGGGIGGDWSMLRADGTATSTGNISTGIIPFLRMVDAEVNAFMQGSTRRGAYAAYLDISHPEIEEFIDIRRPHGTDIQRRCLGVGFHHAVSIPDAFMQTVEAGGTWNLIDPHSGEITKQVDARTLWIKLLVTRMETGEPYLFFPDTANAALPTHLKERGLRINNSNLCNEIMLPTAPDRTAVCCLSSVNLEFYDEWNTNPMFIPDLMEMLDNVLTKFIDEAPDEMWRAKKSAKLERSIGLGSMGFHLYLQKRGIPFGTPVASGINRKIYMFLKAQTDLANFKLGAERGSPPDAEGTGKRFSHTQAIAPNASISLICGNTSPSIEPFNANGFKQDTLSGTFLIKNKELDKLLKEVYNLSGLQYDTVWSSIITSGGSVQHLDFLTELHKEVFKTAQELDQNWIVEHAAVRQEFIDQGQSVNLFIPPDIHKNELHSLHFTAWKRGLKGLYYCRSRPIKKGANITMDLKQDNMDFTSSKGDCLSCEG